MIIDTVEISNLGLWENLFLKFDKSINIIQGENGVGKTTLLALLYSLFHDSGIIKFTNKNQEAYICMNLHDSKEKLVLKKVYKKGQSGYFVSSFADIKKIARMEENKVFIFSGEFLDYDCQLNTKMIKNAMKLLKNVDMERYFSLAYEGVYMSQGQQSVIQILNLLYLIPSNSILLLDAPFAKVDSKIRNNLIEVMKRLKDVQIILTTTITEETEENVSSDCVEVIFQNIADESKIIEELYVVEVVVKSWTNDILFSTSKGEVYIKTEGGKKKLDAYGIQEELRGRLNGF